MKSACWTPFIMVYFSLNAVTTGTIITHVTIMWDSQCVQWAQLRFEFRFGLNFSCRAECFKISWSHSRPLWKAVHSLVLLSAKVTVSQSGRKRDREGANRGETECMLNFLPFLRKYLWRRQNAAGEIVSVRVWPWFRAVPKTLLRLSKQFPTHTYSLPLRKQAILNNFTFWVLCLRLMMLLQLY